MVFNNYYKNVFFTHIVTCFSVGGALLMATAEVVPNFVDIESDGSRVEDGLLSSECDTPVYEKPHFSHYFRQDSTDKHVQFNIGE